MSKAEVLSLLQKYNSFMLTCHISPDGDALGSMTGLATILKELGKEVRLVVADSLPSRYSFLPHFDAILPQFPLPASNTAQVLIAVDCGSWERLSAPPEYQRLITVNIDHHPDNAMFGAYNWVDAEAAAVGEMIFTCAEELKIGLSEELALSLYTAILADTGGFRYANTTAKTHRTAAKLLEAGINHAFIAEKALEERSFAELKLLTEVLSTAEIRDGVGWMELPAAVVQRHGLQLTDIKDLVNYIRSVQEVRVAILFTELQENMVKVSLRSKDPFDVGKLARQFGGGGHARAAGCRVACSLAEAKARVVAAALDLVKER